MKMCKNCAKQYFCNKEKCNFKSWIYTKNYGEVRKDGDTRERKNRNNI